MLVLYFKYNSYNSAKGYSLLEVLIALCILSFGLLGFVQAQLLAVRNSQRAYLQSVAQIRLISLAENIQSCAMAGCSAPSFNNQLQEWNDINAYLLPAGHGNLNLQKNNSIINIKWQISADKNSFEQTAIVTPNSRG